MAAVRANWVPWIYTTFVQAGFVNVDHEKTMNINEYLIGAHPTCNPPLQGEDGMACAIINGVPFPCRSCPDLLSGRGPRRGEFRSQLRSKLFRGFGFIALGVEHGRS